MNIGKRVEEKITLITGGASGIGAETARIFAAHGGKLIVADVQDELGENVVSEIIEDRSIIVPCVIPDSRGSGLSITI